jgi:hypothetical protein
MLNGVKRSVTLLKVIIVKKKKRNQYLPQRKGLYDRGSYPQQKQKSSVKLRMLA